MENLPSGRNRALLCCYLVISACCFLPALGIAFNSPELILGIPMSVLWLTGCFVALAALTVAGYILVFRHWSGDDCSPRDSR